jgi:hypothetical protein
MSTLDGKQSPLEYAVERANATRSAYLISNMGHVMWACTHNRRLAVQWLGGIERVVRPSHKGGK